MKKTAILPATSVALVLVVGLTGCTGASFSGFDNSSSLPPLNKSGVSESAGASSMAMDSAAYASGDTGSGAVSVPAAKLIVNGDATVITPDPTGAATDFTTAVEDLGGTVVSTWESNTDYDHSSSVSAKVPAEKYQDLLAKLPDLGKLQYQNSSTVDVGQEYVDLDARVSALEDSLTRLQELADKAQTTDELLQAEDMLTSRQAELDSLKQQLKWLDDQVAMSTLNVSFTTEVTDPGNGFSWRHAWDLFLQSITAFTYIVVVAVPWLLVAAVAIWLVRFLVRRRRIKQGPEVTAGWVRRKRTVPAAASSIPEDSLFSESLTQQPPSPADEANPSEDN